jgi:hypothetical protein
MFYMTHNDLWWIALTMPCDTFQNWVEVNSWNDEFTDGPLDAPDFV